MGIIFHEEISRAQSRSDVKVNKVKPKTSEKTTRMKNGRKTDTWFRLVLILALLLPVIILFLLPGEELFYGAYGFG
jgi:hypothetical protein